MRITNPTILRGYNRDLNRLLNLKTQTERRITSGRKFSRASECPLSAAKALNVRKSLYYSEQYKENLKVADKFYTEAETSLLQVSEKMAQIRETIIAACNTTKDIQDYNIYAQQLETSAQELCAIFNTDSAERAIFGGESDDPSPFEIINDSAGFPSTVLYHGVPVNAMNDYNKFPYSKEVNIDIGIGMEIDQETQEVDPQSVLCISFNGAKVSGCGAERGVADIDLSSIKSGRIYYLDVYAGDIKKTITFKGQADQDANVAEIQKQLDAAFKKERAYGESFPQIDEQGVVALFKDEVGEDGNKSAVPVENGICCVVNNEYKDPRAEKIVVDNDSGYTNKFKVNVENLSEGEQYSLDVTVGDQDPVTIVFKAGTDDDPALRDASTLKNIQAALDGAFGEGVVNISDGAATKGVISSEGNVVKVIAKDEPATEGAPAKPTITSTSTAKFKTSDFKAGKYMFELPDGTKYDVTLADGETINGKFSVPGYTMDVDGVITKTDGTPATGITCTDESGNVLASSHKTDYAIDAAAMTEGTEYGIKVVYGNATRNITFKAGADANETMANLQAALDKQFGTGNVKLGVNGDNITFAGSNNKGVAVAQQNVPAAKGVVERERVYSNNYIQLTLDAARALRNGDIEYANGCIDRIVSANEHLLVQIADLGCNEEFISFNLDRITTREENLSERQYDLEATDAKKEITLWKTYEAMYNACLQMSSSVVPNSIFNYIK